MGGEPLCEENLFLTCLVVKEVRQALPETKIYLWTGYTYEDLIKKANPKVEEVLKMVDILIDGPYVDSERDITLHMRGSRNQRIIDLSKKI